MQLVDKLEQTDGNRLFKWEHHDIVDNQQMRTQQSLVLPCRRRCNLFEPDGLDEVIHGAKERVITEFQRFMAEPASKIALAGAAWPDQDQVVVLIKPEQLPQLLELDLADSVLNSRVIMVKIMEQRQVGYFPAPFKMSTPSAGELSFK